MNFFRHGRKRKPPNADKEIFVFIHAAKSGGSSFWRSLAKACQNNIDIAVVDAYHESLVRFGTVTRQKDATYQLYQEFKTIRHSKLLIHYHSDEPGLHLLMPHTTPLTYILLVRNETERLKSAYKWYLQTVVLRESASSQDQVMSFFNYFLSKGYSSLLPAIIGVNCELPVSHSNASTSRIALLTIDDYNHPIGSVAMRNFVDLLGCNTPEPFRFAETMTGNQITKASPPPLENHEFWDRVHDQAVREAEFLHSLSPINV